MNIEVGLWTNLDIVAQNFFLFLATYVVYSVLLIALQIELPLRFTFAKSAINHKLFDHMQIQSLKINIYLHICW
jgi:hypothetical protein